jgi:hypothetical protein
MVSFIGGRFARACFFSGISIGFIQEAVSPSHVWE